MVKQVELQDLRPWVQRLLRTKYFYAHKLPLLPWHIHSSRLNRGSNLPFVFLLDYDNVSLHVSFAMKNSQ